MDRPNEFDDTLGPGFVRGTEQRIAHVDCDGLEVTATIHRDNIMGLEFHPERSGGVGQSILQQFIVT